MDIGAMIEAAIRGDMAERRATIAGQRRAIERAGRSRKRIRAQSQGRQHAGARARLDRSSTRLQIDKNEAAVASMERALEIGEGFFLRSRKRRGRMATRSRSRSTMRFIRSTSLRPCSRPGPAWRDSTSRGPRRRAD